MTQALNLPSRGDRDNLDKGGKYMADAQNTPEPIRENELTLKDLADKIDKLAQDVERSDEKFKNYQQATQWVVQLAFTLIASATVTVIITSVVK